MKSLDEDDKRFRTALYGSVFIHALFIVAFFFGMPSFFERFPDEQQVITFEMLPASAISNVPTKAATKKAKQTPKKPEEKPEKAQKIKQSKQQIKETTPEEKPKLEEKKPAPPPKPKQAVEKAKPEQKEPEIKAAPVKPKQKAKPAPAQKPKAKTQKKKVQEDPLDTLLKNLEDSSDGQKAKSPERIKHKDDLADSKFSRGAIYNENSPLSITERMLIKQQIERNWRIPEGADTMDHIEVLFHLKLNKDGTIKEFWVIRTYCPTGLEATCQLVTDSAVRALKKAEPFENLFPERYDSWKEFDLNFDPVQ